MKCSKRFEVVHGSVDVSKGTCRPSDGYPLSKASARYPDVGFRCCRGDGVEDLPTATQTLICPTDMVSQGDICIDQFEYPNLPGVKPISDATFAMAQQACIDSWEHLCSDKEWLYGCEGKLNRRYIWVRI